MGRQGTLKTTLITIGVIAVMLLVFYRRLTTCSSCIFTVMIELTASRGVVAVLANAGIIELSTYSTNLLTLLVIAAGTDYAIFILGRFHEARYAGQDRVAAFTTMYHGTAHIILGFGPDHRRRGVLPDLHPAAVLPEPRRSRRHRRPRRRDRRADAGAGAAGRSAATSACSNRRGR